MTPIWTQKYPKGVPTTIQLDPKATIVTIFEEACRRFAERPCFLNMGKTLSFQETDRLSKNFASFLQHDLGLQPGDRIALQMPNLLQYPIALFGALRAGLVVVNTNPLYTPREMEHQFLDSGVKAVVILANFAQNLEKVLPNTPQIRHVVVTEIGDLLPAPKRWLVNTAVKHLKKMVPAFALPTAISFRAALAKGAQTPPKPVTLSGQDLAFLQYTGGTTGVSKGAMLSHANVVANMEQASFWMASHLVQGQESIITALPLYHIFSLTVNSILFLKYGGLNILITNPRDIGGFIKELKKHPFSVFTGVNTLYNALMNHPDFKTIDFSSLKISVAGAMALQKNVAERWKAATKSSVVEGYGLTETSPIVSCNPIDGTDQTGTIGMPFPSTDIKLVDEDEQEVKMGEPGELCVRGPQVMQGYWNRPDETAKVMKGGWLHTGDVAVMLPDGFFKIVDRKKDMILVSGFNVYPNEVEDVVASHPGVLEVAAVGVPDEKSGEAVKIFVVKKDPALDEETLRNFCRENLTGYKQPKHIEFRSELPKTNVGKILRRALREPIKK